MPKDIFDEENVVSNKWIKFSKIGDNVHGTLVAVREMLSRLPGKEKEMVKIYEIKADGGEFHDMKGKEILEPEVRIAPGEFWNVGGGFMLDNALRNVKLGTKVGIKYTADVPNKKKGFNDMKIKKVYVKKDDKGQTVFDEEWLEANKTFDTELGA